MTQFIMRFRVQTIQIHTTSLSSRNLHKHEDTTFCVWFLPGADANEMTDSESIELAYNKLWADGVR